MNIQDKQQLANLLMYLLGDNCTDIKLPPANDDQNSSLDEHPLAPTWAEEFLVLRRVSDPQNTVCLQGNRCEVDGVEHIIKEGTAA